MINIDVKLRLNPKALEKDDSKAEARVKDAERRKRSANETMGEAWQRILSMKNSESDDRRLREVKQAMADSILGREPNAKGKFSKAEALRLWRVLEERNRSERLRQMVEDTPDNYWLITDKSELNELLTILNDENEIVFDVETTGTDVWNDYIVGHVITAIKADVHAYIPTKHKSDHVQLDHDYVTEKLRPYYEDESLGKLAHNAKFDIHMLDRDGVDLRGLTWDTQEAMRMLNENEMSFALKNLVTKYLRIESQTYGELFGKGVGFDEVGDLRIALAYAAKDGDVTRKLRDFQIEHLRKMPEILRYYETIEVPLIKTVMVMEKTGFDIDLDYAETYGKEMQKEIEKLSDDLVKGLGDININSHHQLKPALERLTGKKLDSTDAKKVLQPLSNDFPIIAKLLEYKKKTKLYSTYISVLPELIDKRTGKLHANFNQNGAATGRFSSGGSGVNLQNQPKDARQLFVAPPGYVLLGGDWSQQEVRCLAHFTQEPTLIEAYRNGLDIYASMASEVFEKPYEDCGDGTFERKAMKTGVLASMYGTGPKTLAQQLGITEKEAKSFLDDFFKRLPKVAEWIEANKKFVRKHGFVYMDEKQRKRRLPNAKNRKASFGQQRQAERQATNARVQGTSAIQTKATMNDLLSLCERKGDWKMWCVVHDEAILLVPETVTRDDIKDFEKVMLGSYVFGNIPNKTDIEISKRWGEGITVEEWFSERD